MEGTANYIAKGLIYSDGRDHCSESYKHSTMLLKLEKLVPRSIISHYYRLVEEIGVQ